ncbi:hypothetical protein QL996_14375 [Planococcus sp. APC 4015]|nr:hypothetical protein [Planococcus sp. APC 4015]
MGDDDRRHLDELRRRAYGPGDGLTDAADIARLEELDAAARAERRPPVESDPVAEPYPVAERYPAAQPYPGTEPHPTSEPRPAAQPSPVAERYPVAELVEASAPGDGPSTSSGTGSGSGTGVGSGTGPAAGGRGGGIRRSLLVLGAAVAAVAVVAAVFVPRLTGAGPIAGTPSAVPTETLATPDDVPVIRQTIDDAATDTITTIELGGYFTQPAPSPAPALPVNGAETWIETVGVYFGQRVWIAGTDEGDVCLVLEAESTTRTSCLPFDMFEDDMMLLTVPYSDLPEDERPPGMTDDELLGFWWRSDDRVEIVLVPSQPGSGEY